MEVPNEVLIHNDLLGLKGSRATLIRIAPEGYYELNLRFGANTHRVLMPLQGTVVIAAEAEPTVGESVEVER
jgi:hypothetical protein